jgi:hypothetical protein
MLRHARYVRAANQHSGMFTSVLSNVADLSLQMGFDAAAHTVTYTQYATIREATDFKASKRSALHVGNLQETVEGMPFPEMDQKDSGYDPQLGLWGVTFRLSLQTLVNDELGEFLRKISQAGPVAQRTFDRECARQIMDATWTNDVSTGVPLGTAGSLDTVREALRGKLDNAGNRMGMQAAFLLHAPQLAKAADEALGVVQLAGGRTEVLASRIAQRTVGIEVDPLADTGLSSNALGTTYYVLADPAMVDTVLAQFLNGMREPQIMEFDPGAVAGQSWKVFQPFSATVATHTDSNDATRVSGMQKATAA